VSAAAAPRLPAAGRHLAPLAPLLAAAFVLALYSNRLALVTAAVVAPPVMVWIAVRPEWGVAIVLGLTPFISVAIPLGESGSVQLLRGALPLLALWSLAQAIALSPRPAVRASRPQPALVLTILAVLAAMALSAMLSIEPRGTLRFMFEFTTGVIAFFAAAQVTRRPQGTERVLLGAMLGLLAVSVYGLGQALRGAANGGTFYVGPEAIERVQASFVHPNYFATYLMVLIPVGAAVALSKAYPR
jgi:hypothetical protein